MPATCLVSAADYARYWGAELPESQPAPYCGRDRRRAKADRRAPGHDRRWDASRGRRFRVLDRRQGG